MLTFAASNNKRQERRPDAFAKHMKKYRIVTKVWGKDESHDHQSVVAVFDTKEQASETFRHYAEDFLCHTFSYDPSEAEPMVERLMASSPDALSFCTYTDDCLMAIEMEEFEEKKMTVRVTYRSEVYITGTEDEIRQKWAEFDPYAIIDESRLPKGISVPEYVGLLTSKDDDTCEDFSIE